MAVNFQLYLDACAATPPHGEVLAAMASHGLEAWGNPSSLHAEGLKAADLLERSRLELASLLGMARGEVIFTSGGTEANNLALFGICRRLPPGRLLLSPLEHASISAAAYQLQTEGWQIDLVPVNSQGIVDLEALADLLKPPTRLLSLVWGSSDVGSLQPMAEVSSLCSNHGVLLHSDAVQAVGEVSLDLGENSPNLISLSAHKFQGPRGIGALLISEAVQLQPQIFGGGQEGGKRSGTESVVLAAGLVKALELRQQQQPNLANKLADLRDFAKGKLLKLPGVRISGAIEPSLRLPHHLSLLLSDSTGKPFSGRSVVRSLARKGVACSSGSACSSGRETANKSLMALGYNELEAASGLRFSFGPWLEQKDLEPLPALLEATMAELEAARSA